MGGGSRRKLGFSKPFMGSLHSYLDPNSSSMQKPIGGRSLSTTSAANNSPALNKGRGGHTERPLFPNTTDHPLNGKAVLNTYC
jgi:hypothetical protein